MTPCYFASGKSHDERVGRDGRNGRDGRDGRDAVRLL